jgi:hypothetical protein
MTIKQVYIMAHVCNPETDAVYESKLRVYDIPRQDIRGRYQAQQLALEKFKAEFAQHMGNPHSEVAYLKGRDLAYSAVLMNIR